MYYPNAFLLARLLRSSTTIMSTWYGSIVFLLRAGPDKDGVEEALPEFAVPTQFTRELHIGRD